MKNVTMAMDLKSATSEFGEAATRKLKGTAIAGAPENQLRAPLERYLEHLARLCGLPDGALVLVGETSLADLKTRPDYAASVNDALVGFIEVKAPGKGADPRRFTDRHDRDQWARLKALPNLIYTDGNAFSLWRNGELEGTIARLDGDVETSSAKLSAPQSIVALIQSFLTWRPVAPRSAKDLAEVSARLCRLLRDEVAEQMARDNVALTALARDWRTLLFPTATDQEFADGYAQAVTFGLLVARARGIGLADGLERAASELRRTNSLIGTALRLLTDQAENQSALKTSLATLARVLDVVDWSRISKGDPDAWLYFYEQFLSVYDNDLRKKTGSYYTPPQVVRAMVGLVDETLRSPERFGRPTGLAAKDVTIADPAVGTGTYLLGILRRIADTVEADQGAGAVDAAIRAAIGRVIGFELQFGPFAVAQLRLLAEIATLDPGVSSSAAPPIRLFITDTLGNPYAEQEWIPAMFEPLAVSRREANAIKREEAITVVIGNPPYKEKAKGRGGWIEQGSVGHAAPLLDWMPPPAWGVSAHAKHLRNLYVYFWRWAAWKVFGPTTGRGADAAPDRAGIVCFITVAGFLEGAGFQRMRDDLRRSADEIWVIDCSPEGHQPDVPTRIFEGVQQPVCIVMAARTRAHDATAPAQVRHRRLPKGPREAKFNALLAVGIDDGGWATCPTDWRAPFLPASTGAWASYPALEDCFAYDGSGVMPGRTWVIAPDEESLRLRWDRLRAEKDSSRKEVLFHPHLRKGLPGDKHLHKPVAQGIGKHEHRPGPVATDQGGMVTPVRYAFRSLDRQYIVPDARLLNQPNPTLWSGHSGKQVYLTALDHPAPTSGPGFAFSAAVPDLHHFSGRGGRVYPLWADQAASRPNISPALLDLLAARLGTPVTPEDVFAYIAAIGGNPAYTGRFAADLGSPPIRIPFTTDPDLFRTAATIGREVVWLQSYGERFADDAKGRPSRPPRLPKGRAPTIPAGHGIGAPGADMPDTMSHDASANRLLVGTGIVDNVTTAMWDYAIGGKQVLRQWFSYRKADRSRPIMGDRRPPSPLGDIQPCVWPAEYTADLLDLLNVIGRLIDLEPAQTTLLAEVCADETITAADLATANASAPKAKKGKAPRARDESQPDMLD